MVTLPQFILPHSRGWEVLLHEEGRLLHGETLRLVHVFRVLERFLSGRVFIQPERNIVNPSLKRFHPLPQLFDPVFQRACQ